MRFTRWSLKNNFFCGCDHQESSISSSYSFFIHSSMRIAVTEDSAHSFFLYSSCRLLGWAPFIPQRPIPRLFFSRLRSLSGVLVVTPVCNLGFRGRIISSFNLLFLCLSVFTPSPIPHSLIPLVWKCSQIHSLFNITGYQKANLSKKFCPPLNLEFNEFKRLRRERKSQTPRSLSKTVNNIFTNDGIYEKKHHP